MIPRCKPLYAALLGALSAGAFAQQSHEAPVKTLGTVTVIGGQPTSLPTQIPTTIEGVTGKQVEVTVNATDSEDALKYLPSLLVRKRYIGDFNHAVLSTRASGTGNSARSMVFADGILLSNFLGNGATFAPRWGLVTPEEIERVDVLYGPFSAAYPGNSVGAVVDYVTRMPIRFEAHAKLGYSSQDFDLYGTSERDSAKQASVSAGNRSGAFSWWFNLNRLDSAGQPMVIANRLVSDGANPAAGTPVVTGAIGAKNHQERDWWILGTTTKYHTVQDHAKLKLAYDFSPTIRASYTLGLWHNNTTGGVESYLRDAAGNPVYAGDVVIGDRQYKLDSPSLAFAPSRNDIQHVMHGLSVKTNTKGMFDWEVAASLYDYQKDIARAPTAVLPAAFNGGAGRITDMDGTGWNTLSVRGTWRPTGSAKGVGAHVVDFGVQQEEYKLRTLVSNTADWINGDAGLRFSAFNGNAQLRSLYAQDTWQFAQDWKTTLGGRYEMWRAWGGELGNAARILPFGTTRDENFISPKAAIAFQASPDLVLKASTGRAVRMPTVGELYQGSISGNEIINTDPDLKPEKSWTTELSAERMLPNGMVRATLFFERTRDALYSQPLSATVSTVQNVDKVRTNGLELAFLASDVGVTGLELNGSLTYADSVITANSGNPASVGKRQPRVPKWRATALATYKPDANWAYSLGARYSGTQYGQLDNSDTNGFSYLGFSKYFVTDVRVRYQIARQWSAAFGIDNLNNYKYWAFHPYPQRTYVAELKFDM
ncbi:TonB-dependent receptor [Noviherbaspirillum denitrificans]|uniref:TonB-dependent receptor n=1 Tax=Noviherbaspirillum denitrificans TaxID=1968433 RepID=A0A254TJ56_9BURK|nr:TonB-dependent receptor [Noviherbaspirillum denitrificans]OWW21352.1 TonB-dependent receptor [Noviherbaspirillum denitrificans]